MTQVTLQGNPLTLSGPQPKPGDNAPDFTVLDTELQPVHLSDYAGKVVILSSVPSLDTPVCDMETRHFNTEAASLSEDIVILTISVDLPFAQKRWCGASGVEQVKTLSDHRDLSFGEHYGLVITELRLLARCVMVVDRQGALRYRELIPEIADEPDYDAVLKAARDAL